MKKIRRKKREKTSSEKAYLLHNYYSRTGFYMFIWESLKKAFLPIIIVVVALFFVDRYVFDINDGLEKGALKIKAVKLYLEVKMAKHLKNTGKWGGFLILVGALLPVPFSISCMAAGMIRYSFKNVVLFGLFRFLRFGLYAWAIFKVVD